LARRTPRSRRSVLTFGRVEAGVAQHAERADVDELVDARVGSERREVARSLDVDCVQRFPLRERVS